MHQFGSDTITTMRSVLEEVCSHIPRDSTAARSFIASRILECASKGERTHKGLLVAARRAVIDLRQMANVVLITDEDAKKPPSASFFLTRALQPDPQALSGFRVVPVKPLRRRVADDPPRRSMRWGANDALPTRFARWGRTALVCEAASH